MTIYIQKLDACFNEGDLDYIRNYVLSFHSTHLTKITYDPGKLTHTPALGYYIPLFESTHESRNVKSWEKITNTCDDNLNVSVIKMNLNSKQFQNLYVVKHETYFNEEFYVVLNRILKNIPIEFETTSTTASVQEFGYSMKFHIDAGVQSRIHINLNKDSLDYFYTSDGSHRMHYGECYLFEASKTNHGFMSFQPEPRIHLIMDIP